MLNLNVLVAQIGTMIAQQGDSQADYIKRLEAAIAQLVKGPTWKQLAKWARSLGNKTSWLIAVPLEDPRQAFKLPEPVTKYNVFATDGSQIAPDHHELLMCYLLNIGQVFLSYGTGQTPLLESTPRLYYENEELYIQHGRRRELVQGELLATKRTVAEFEALAQLVVKYRSDLPSIAMSDGTLIGWQIGLSEAGGLSEHSRAALHRCSASMETCRKYGIPVVGYISGSRSADVVNLTRLLFCQIDDKEAIDCDRCDYAEPGCQQADGLNDRLLFSHLKPGERSAVFLSQSKILEHYDKLHRIAFFYLNVGTEIVRIELPLWVFEDARLLALVHSLCYDQAQKGMGYPVAISEAHELAVVKGFERKQFFEMVEAQLVRAGVPVGISNKNLSKRRPIV